jgi:hypothetical protein
VRRTSSTRVVVREAFSYKVTSVGVTIFMPGTVVIIPRAGGKLFPISMPRLYSLSTNNFFRLNNTIWSIFNMELRRS